MVLCNAKWHDDKQNFPFSPLSPLRRITLQCENIAHCFRFRYVLETCLKELGLGASDGFPSGGKLWKNYAVNASPPPPPQKTQTWGTWQKSFCATHERWVHGRWEFSILHSPVLAVVYSNLHQGMTVKMREMKTERRMRNATNYKLLGLSLVAKIINCVSLRVYVVRTWEIIKAASMKLISIR